jgi:hypothetical protein
MVQTKGNNDNPASYIQSVVREALPGVVCNVTEIPKPGLLPTTPSGKKAVETNKSTPSVDGSKTH